MVHAEATLADREIGIKVMSDFGSSESGGDYDETPTWEDSCTLDFNGDGLPDNYPPNCDTNEQIIELRLRAQTWRYTRVVDETVVPLGTCSLSMSKSEISAMCTRPTST